MATPSVRGLLFFSGVATITGLALAGDTVSLSSNDGTTAKLVARMVESRHIAHPEIDDELSRRLLHRYVDAWDPQKLYFLQSDIDDFSRNMSDLDDQIESGNLDFATLVFERVRKRMYERAETISQQIDAAHDYSVDEEMITDPDDLDWAASVEVLSERWRKRIKFDLLMLKLDDTDLDEARTRLHKRYKRSRGFLDQTEGHEILEQYLSSMTHCLDPHSSYMSPQTLLDFKIVMSQKLEGIGARLRFDDGYTLVEEVIEGGAAAEDGRLIKGDKIIGVDPDGPDKPAELIDVVEMKLTKVVDNIRGKSNTEVTLQVRKEAGGTEEYVLTRQTVQIEDQDVEGKIIETGNWFEGRQEKIGIINIPSFYRDFSGASSGGLFKSTSRDVRKELVRFRKQGVDALIVDLRWNGGGALTEAVEVTGLFIPKGPVVQVREPGNTEKILEDEDPEMYWREPMIVVCNRLSASASEIFAGAIKDYRRGLVVGDRTTHGKGTVQNVMPVTTSLFGGQRGALKLTISKFYRVNGDSTQTRGVISDVILPSVLDHRDIGEDSLDNALAFDRISHAGYVPYSSFLNDSMKEELGVRSEARVKTDKEFTRLNRAIARYEERKKRKTISLNEETLRHEEEAIKREQEEQEEMIRKASGVSDEDTRDIFKDDFYNRELMQITLDYLEMRNTLRTVNR
ncbi:MAG: carboxy terminal-processing peptidase [Fuerstiella sp.]|nr:carboxy terminal-processing peptidase [Fuerstiella sp.]